MRRWAATRREPVPSHVRLGSSPMTWCSRHTAHVPKVIEAAAATEHMRLCDSCLRAYARAVPRAERLPGLAAHVRGGLPVLSVIQPWAWLIVHGGSVGIGKGVENRVWSTSYRGPVLIHASARMSLDVHYDAGMFVQRAFGVEAALRLPHRTKPMLYDYGGIIGVASLVDVLIPTETPADPWHVPGQFGFVLRDAKPLPFHRCKGRQRFFYEGFWLVDGSLVQDVAAA